MRDDRNGAERPSTQGTDLQFMLRRTGLLWAHVTPAQTGCGAALAAWRELRDGLTLARVTAATLSAWRDAFLAAGGARLSTRSMDGETLQSGRLKARLGEMLLERELLEAKIALLEARDGHPLARARQRR